jgi:DNA polymerase-3 subunit gamma/tau
MLTEKYQPKRFKDFVGQERLIEKLKVIGSRKDWFKDVFWFQGPSGIGKTSLAWIIARQLARDWNIEEMDGNKCTQDAVRKLEVDFNYSAMGGGWKVVIVNEAHAMTRQAVQVWLHTLERLPDQRLVIFTTTEKIQSDLFGNFSNPFGSRCKIFDFKTKGLSKLFAAMVRKIAIKEHLGKPTLKQAEYLIKFCKNNLRLALQRVDAMEFVTTK